MFKRLGLATIACLTLVIGAIAQQWLPFPIIGGSSFCTSTVNSTCVNTVAAGPAMTGLETIPADTNATPPGAVQTAKFPLQTLQVGPYQYTAPLTGASVTLAATSRRLIIDPAGTIAALTVVLQPSQALVDNQMFSLCSTQIVTALTITPGTGTTVSNTVTALTVPLTTGAASCPEWVYRAANTNWYRVH